MIKSWRRSSRALPLQCKRVVRMKRNIENWIYAISDSESIIHDDELSELIAQETEDELSEEMLEYVSAAGVPDYEKFQRFLENMDKKN